MGALALVILLAGCGSGRMAVADNANAILNVWYGPLQHFGRPGLSQKWVNVLGTVVHPEAVEALTFSLNRGPESRLKLGPDRRRLLNRGDFNVEIHRRELERGLNRLDLIARDAFDGQLVREVGIEYHDGVWPLPYEIDWGSVSRIQDVVQVVDGLWRWSEEGARTEPSQVGYDRVLAIGDRSWTDYEVTVPVTLHGIDDSAFGSPISIAPGVGVLMRWSGHTDSPVRCAQPHCGWQPTGAMNWFDFHVNQVQLTAGQGRRATVKRKPLEVGKTYWFRARVESPPSSASRYRLKVWEGRVEDEPAEWQLERIADEKGVSQGSLLLVAHHVDVTFGNLSVKRVDELSAESQARRR